MRVLAAALLLLTSACAAAAPAADPGPAGSFALIRLNARDLPAESPTEPGVTVERGTLTLEADGRFTMELAARTGAQTASTQTVRGTYSAQGDELALLPDGAPEEAALRFTYSADRVGLRLRDERGNEYVFGRR